MIIFFFSCSYKFQFDRYWSDRGRNVKVTVQHIDYIGNIFRITHTHIHNVPCVILFVQRIQTVSYMQFFEINPSMLVSESTSKNIV